MPERKTPVKLIRGPLTGAIFALTNYKVIQRPGMEPLYEARLGGKHDVTTDFEDLVLALFLVGNEDVMPLLDAIVKGHIETDLSESDKVALRDLHNRFGAIIERHNARIGEAPEVPRES